MIRAYTKREKRFKQILFNEAFERQEEEIRKVYDAAAISWDVSIEFSEKYIHKESVLSIWGGSNVVVQANERIAKIVVQQVVQRQSQDMFVFNFARRTYFRKAVDNDPLAKVVMLFGLAVGQARHLGAFGMHFESFKAPSPEVLSVLKEAGLNMFTIDTREGEVFANIDHDIVTYATREIIRLLIENKDEDFLGNSIAPKRDDMNISVRDAMYYALSMVIHPVLHDPKFLHTGIVKNNLLNETEVKKHLSTVEGGDPVKIRDRNVRALFKGFGDDKIFELLNNLNQGMDVLVEYGLVDPRTFLWRTYLRVGMSHYMDIGNKAPPEYKFRGSNIEFIQPVLNIFLDLPDLFFDDFGHLDRRAESNGNIIDGPNREYLLKGAEGRSEFFKLYLMLGFGEVPTATNLYPNNEGVINQGRYLTPKVDPESKEVYLDVRFRLPEPKSLGMIVHRYGIHPNFVRIKILDRKWDIEEGTPARMIQNEKVIFVYGLAANNTKPE